ncbi:hypothetical protein K505DRAFT_421596 [Melanomma pulvis-pyrius CBS 109.77]|uniref:Uncharacterized protein n=1 Tax=Melanomma pulvis-pyrius CBS 109.77 TaxID=1314802 RepID=A0A6A6WUY7_9PLEO|nr:hypothetical protein K505DRAFT_421596 [Melanomma pulvis-pyrius CBS 109.77]
MYTITASRLYATTTYEMRGHRSSTLGGNIQVETGKGVRGKWTKIWHLTRNSRRDSLNPENETRLQKYGYQPEEEWDKRLLIFIRRGLWEDSEGKRVAAETDDGSFEVLGNVNGPQRDLFASCWAMKVWISDGIRWEGDIKA